MKLPPKRPPLPPVEAADLRDVMKASGIRPKAKRGKTAVSPKRGKTAVSPTEALTMYAVRIGLGQPQPEYQFCERKWAFDLAWPRLKVAVEIEGAVFGTGKPCPACKRRRPGGHSSVTGLLRDIAKYNRGAILGWTILRVTPDQVSSGEAFGLLDEIARTR